MLSVQKLLPTRFYPVLLGIWVFAAAVLFILNGWHYDVHAVTLGLLSVLGFAMILLTSYLMTQRLRERERSETMLRQSHERYSSLVENSLTGIFIGKEGSIRFS